MPAALDMLNRMQPTQAVEALLKVCGSIRWATHVASSRPFDSLDRLFATAESAADCLEPPDWLEAFSHHPRIGETDLGQQRYAATAPLSTREQSAMTGADTDTRAALLAGNREYERKFGHVFLICATGKSAQEMLDHLNARLANDPQAELRIAAQQQRQITRLRLETLFSP